MSAPLESRIDDMERAWGWVEHLIAGGTTPWLEFSGGARSRGDVLPGAIQLEVARRVNLSAAPAAHPALISQILESSAPGRGQPDLALVGLPVGTTFGPRPVDPAALPASELLRMTIGFLAELVAERGPRPAPTRPRAPLRPWRRGYHLYGDPLTVTHTRSALAQAGHAPGRRSPVAVLLADDVGTMLGDVWQWRVRHATSTPWHRWVSGFARRDALPRPLDLPGTAAHHATRLGAQRVHVVIGPDPAAEVARLLGVRDVSPSARSGLCAEAVEVVRQVNLVLRVLAPQDLHRSLLETVLMPALSSETGRNRAVPARHLPWLRHCAERMCDELDSAGYSVHGDLGALIPVDHHYGPDPDDDGVLAVALRTLLRVREIES